MRYGDDLAYVHDRGFTDFTRDAGQSLLQILKERGVASGLVVDLGCGTGVIAEQFAEAGYRVLGVDLSPAMLRIARRRARGAKFRLGSLHNYPLPRCDAVTSVGECIGYLPGTSTESMPKLQTLFSRVFDALRPGGLFVFDFLEMLRTNSRTGTSYRLGDDWAVCIRRTEHKAGRLLTRYMTTFRRVGVLYRRSEETHCVRVFQKNEVATVLRGVGFQVQSRKGYGSAPIEPGHRVLVAQRPAE